MKSVVSITQTDRDVKAKSNREPKCLVAGDGANCKRCCANCEDRGCIRRCKNSPDKCGSLLVPEEKEYKTSEARREAGRRYLRKWRENQKQFKKENNYEMGRS